MGTGLLVYTFYTFSLSCCFVLAGLEESPLNDSPTDYGDEDGYYQKRLVRESTFKKVRHPHNIYYKYVNHEEEDEMNGYVDNNKNKHIANEHDWNSGDTYNLNVNVHSHQASSETKPTRTKIRGSNNSVAKKSSMLRTSKNGEKRLPQALIIGVKKGGTRALLEFLRIHPDVRAPGPEIHFFDRHYHRGIDWYRQQMPPSIEGQLTMEKTPSYFVTKGVPGRIFNMSKGMKLIVVVRDPVTRAISDYTQAASKRTDVRPFEEMAFLDNVTGLVNTSWGAIRIGVYAKYLDRWLKFFPLRQLCFVNGEKLITDPALEMKHVQRFLGINHVITDKHFYFNSSKGFPCLKKKEGNGVPHCLGKSKGRQHPSVNPRVIKRLREFYRPFNARFYQLTGQDFGWL